MISSSIVESIGLFEPNPDRRLDPHPILALNEVEVRRPVDEAFGVVGHATSAEG
jgi:hypothetical protein